MSKNLFVSLQHKLRGYISDYKSSKFARDQNVRSTLRFRSNVNGLYLDARVTITPNQFKSFLKWSQQQINTQLPQLTHIPIGYNNLSGIYSKAPKAALEIELSWITERIIVERNKINAFLLIARKIEFHIFREEFEEAIEEIKQVEKKLGASIWGIQLRIALENMLGGVDQQKKYTSEVSKVFRTGLLAFISFYTSTRNESKTTVGKYIENTKNRINRHKFFSPKVKTYLNYQLAFEAPITASGLAEILHIEQNHSLIDLFETFIFVIQEITKKEYFKKYHEKVAQCVQALDGIKDYRIDKIKILIDDSYHPSTAISLAVRDSEISNQLFSGNVKQAALLSRHINKKDYQVDPWQLIYSGCAFGHRKSNSSITTEKIQDIPLLIGTLLNRNEYSFDALSQLSKIVVNLKGLPTCIAISDFLEMAVINHPDHEYRPWLIGLNSSFIGIEDASPLNFPSFKEGITNKHTPTIATWACFYSAKTTNHNNILFTVARLVRDREYFDAIELLESQQTNLTNEPLKSFTVSLLLQSKSLLGDRESLINIIAEEGSNSIAYRLLLPTKAILQSFQWRDYTTDPLTTSVALHLLWVENESEETASLLRFSIRKVLTSVGANLPSELYDYRSSFSKSLLVYFLKEACITDFIDQIPSISNSKELMEERQHICGSLIELDPNNISIYQDENSSITYRLAMNEGRRIVDRTRIHVDTEALKRWAIRELSEDFARYHDLRGVCDNSDVVLEDIIKEMMSDNIAGKKAFIPETESDIVLIEIIKRLSDEYLNNSSFGLDFYLSKRIRHQSFISLIRSPVESAQLITTRESEIGRYKQNKAWLTKFKNIDSKNQSAIDNSFKRFSIKFDSILTDAKDNSFQILSKNKPKGLLYLHLSPQVLFVLQSITRADNNISDLVTTAIEIFWAALEPSLIQVRNFINEEIKTDISAAFYELRASIKSNVGEKNPAYLELDQVIGKSLTDVQSNLDISVQWFRRLHDSDLQNIQQTFNLPQMVDIAIESALKCHRTFDPEINIQIVEDDTQMAISSLVFLYDVMFVALGNAHKYSNVKKPKVDIIVKTDARNGTFTIDICCDAKGQKHEETNKKLKRIRELINSKNYGRARSEGQSGFIKLAAVVQQTPKGVIKFGYNDSGNFQLLIIYSLIVQTITTE